MDKKTIRNDIILVGSLLLVAVICLIIVLANRVKTNLIAKISVQNQVVETIDLSKVDDAHYYIDGLKGKVHVHVKDGGIAIIESNCPHQDCVRMGYVKETNRPIICAYNAVYIVIEGSANYDTEIG